MNFNKCVLAGRMVRDVELRYSPKGSAMANFGIAVNRSWKNEAGEKKDETTFVDVTAFGKQAETLSQYFKKGSSILIEGRLKLDQWEDKEHQKHSKLKVVMEGFSFVESRSGDPQKRAEEPQRSPEEEPQPDPMDDPPF